MVAGSSPFCRRMSAWAVKRAGGLNSFLGGFYVLKGFLRSPFEDGRVQGVHEWLGPLDVGFEGFGGVDYLLLIGLHRGEIQLG